MNECMSCGNDLDGPPRGGDGGHCRFPLSHATPQPHQMWVWLDERWQIKGSGGIGWIS